MTQTIQEWLAAFLTDGAVDPETTYDAAEAKSLAERFANWLDSQ